MKRPIIIGAGPIGSNTGRLIKKLNPLLIERGERIGLPVQCTGIVSTRLQKITGFPDELIINTARGAKLVGNKREVIIDGGKTMAHIIDRQGFDEWIYQRFNGESHLKERFINYDNSIVKTSKGSYQTDLVIDCSGPKKGLLGVQAVTKLKKNLDFVELHFNASPNFFGWVVPINNEYCRVGLAAKTQSMPKLKSFLKKLKAGPVKEWNAGLIPIQVNEFIQDHLIRCGDAAGQVKATTGGGLVTGLLSSKIMSDSILKAYEANDFSKEFFKKQYYEPWNKSLGKELRTHSLANRVINSMDNDDLIKFIEHNKIIIQSYGDMDFMNKYLFKLLKPSNLWFGLKALFKTFF